jgi:hypothetical protein
MKRIKRLNEFLAADPTVMPGKPTTAPPAAPPSTPTRPARPIPTKRPGEKEKEKPMAAFQEVMDIFFDELRAIKNTPEGAKIIKKLHKKYAQG